MTEEISDTKMFDDAEDGEILEDGEIADDEDNTAQNATPFFNSVADNAGSIKDEKENKESNQSEFGSVSFCRFAKERDDHFKSNKRKKKANKKRKLANGNDPKKMFRDQLNDSATSRELVDISQWLNESSFDNVDLSDEDEYNFDVLDFEVLMEILGCTADSNAFNNVLPDQRRQMMLRIVKIMKNINGNDSDTSRRFARLKRRTRDRKNSFNGSQSSNSNSAAGKSFKAVCKFYLEGKCHKGSDCNFSHDCTVPKRKELCKFYLQGFCGKGDDCLFMHGEFPCKFFHTNTECYSGEKCRFSHSPLTDDTRGILRNYLDSGTLPDDPKPFRPAVFSANSQKNEDDANDMDLMEFDSSFNYETEIILSKPRPVLLGNPTNRVKTSYNTWKWQQELKELEKSYTGLKKNLFCIDDVFAIVEKPPTPRIEDDEEEIEAQIQNYYSDMLDTDDLDEMVALQEIEDHRRKVQEEELIMKNKPFDANPFSNNEELSEEEKRLIEASAHDEDLRILPGHMPIGGPFAMNISNAFDQPSYNPTNIYLDNEPSTHKSFNPIDNENNSVTEPNYSEIGVTPSSASNEIFSADVSNMVRQVRNGSIGKLELSQPSNSPNSKPEYRDPRLNRLKESNRMPTSPIHSNTSPNISSFSEDKSISKPFIKICSPNVVIDYKLVLVTVSKINYSCYFDFYHSDNALKNDPRLKKFFSSTPPALLNNSSTDLNNCKEPDSSHSKVKTELTENLMTLPALNTPFIKKVNTIIKPPVPSKILSPLELISPKNATESDSISRDPRIRSKELDHQRADSNRKSLDDNSVVPTPFNKAKVTEVNGTSCELNNMNNMNNMNESNSRDNIDNDNTNRSENIATVSGAVTTATATNLSSIPSYAIAALPSTRSLFSSVSSNLMFSSYPVTDKLNANSLSSTDSYSKSFENDHNNLSENDNLIDEEKDNVLSIDTMFDVEANNLSSNVNNNNNNEPGPWPTNISNTIDSDNEMEIDLQRHNESEMDSENENELIIASSSEPEDNKDCDNASTDSLTINNNYSINC